MRTKTLLVSALAAGLASCATLKKTAAEFGPPIEQPPVGDAEEPEDDGDGASEGYLVVQRFKARKKPGSMASRTAATYLAAPATAPWASYSAANTDLGTLKVHFIQVGQGSTTAIKCPEENGKQNVIVVDAGGNRGNGGPPPNFEDTAARQLIEDLAGEAETVHAVFVTHPDRDHFNSLASIVGDLRVEQVHVVGKLEDYSHGPDAHEWLVAKKNDLGKNFKELSTDITVRPYEGVNCGSATIHVVARGVAKEKNARSLVMVITHGDADFVLTGDATSPTENKIIKKFKAEGKAEWLESEVLQVGHHGSKTSTGQKWVDAIKPSISIISALPGHSYKHPRHAVFDRLDQTATAEEVIAHDITVEETVKQDYRKAIFNVGEEGTGTMVVESDGEWITAYYFADEPPADDDPVVQKQKAEAAKVCSRTCERDFKPCGWVTPGFSPRDGTRNPQCLRGAAYDKCISGRGTKHLERRDIWQHC